MGQDLVKNTKVSGSYESLSFRSPNGINSSTSKFSETEMRNLVKLFNSLAALSPHDCYINKMTFEHYFPLGGILAKRLFVAFDKNKNGLIDLQEFIDGMAMCLQGSLDEKYQIAFEMFDLDGTNGVSADELYVVLKSVLLAATRVYQDDPVISHQDYSDIELDQLAKCIVKDAYQQQASDLNQDSKMTLKVFKSWIEKHPFVLDSIFGQTCLKDKTLQYGRLRSSEENLFSYSKRSSSVKKQTWVTSKKESVCREEPFDGSYAKADYLWSPVFPQMTSKPCKRCKLAACLLQDSVYLYGGRGICTSLKDFWRYDIGENAWYPIPDRGGMRPSYLQEHTMLPYKDNLVVFGGEFTSYNETPLWLYNTNTSTWTKPSAKQKGPTNRRGHSAVIAGDSLYIFGGYVDLRGATRELWKYEFTSNTWTREKSQSKGWPSPRYAHSAAVFDKSMVICGGLEEMECKNDLWLWNMAARKWTKIKGRNSPPPLFGHSAVKVGDGMVVFGGESTDGSTFNIMWRFNFDSLSWSTINPKGMISPPPRSHHSLIQVPDFRFSSLRPTSSRSAPPCTPAYDRELPNLREDKEPIDSNELNVKNITNNMSQAVSLGSLDSTALLSNTEDELVKIRLNPTASRSASLDSLVTKIGLSETENMSMVNHDRTFSQDSILSYKNQSNTCSKVAITTERTDKVALDSNTLLPPAKPGAGRGIRLVRQQFKLGSVESLSPYSKSNGSIFRPTNVPEVTNTGIINLMVLGGLSKRGIESSDRSMDTWKCSVNPEKKSNSIKRIEVQATSPTANHPVSSSDTSYAYENLSIEDHEEYNDSDEPNSVKECVLMDVSDGDNTSVDVLITDNTAGKQSLARISV